MSGLNYSNEKEVYSEFIRHAKIVYDSAKASDTELTEFKHKPHFFVLYCVMNSQINYERAWGIPYVVAADIGDSSFKAFSEQTQRYYTNLFEEKKLHRFNTSMSKAFYFAIKRIENQYDSEPRKIWSDKPSSADLVYRFLEFDRIGVKNATMAANVLVRNYKVPLKDYFSIDISPDTHIKRVFYRMGFSFTRQIGIEI